MTSAARYCTERWALRPLSAAAAPGLRVLALRVGRADPKADKTKQPDLWQASVIWPGRGEVGLLVYTEVLPMELNFTVQWSGPNGESFQRSTIAAKHAYWLWMPLPTRQQPAPGSWRVALHLAKSAPSGPRLLAWRRFAVLGAEGEASDAVKK